MTETTHQRLLVVDFGSQVTQLIARRLREANIYAEIHPYQKVDAAFLRDFAPQAVILSGGPASVTEPNSPRVPEALFDLEAAVLGICYGQQAMMEQLGGKVEAGHHAEFGRAFVSPAEAGKGDPLFAGLFVGGREEVWMSHGDRVTQARARLRGARRLAERALRHRRRPGPAFLRGAVPPGGASHAERRAAPEELHRSRGLHRRLDDGRPTRTRPSRRSGRRSAAGA